MYPSDNELVSLDVAGGGSPVTKLRYFWQRVERLKSLKQHLNTEVCISHLEGADYINLLSKGTEKVILCVHGSKLHDANITGPLGWLRKNLLMPFLYNRADRIVTVSRDINPELIESFGVKPEKIVTINNFFEVDKVEVQSLEALSSAEKSIFNAEPVLITSGRLAPQKNQLPFLDAFAAVLPQHPAKLVFVGDGELRTMLTDRARELGLKVYAAWETPAPPTPEYDVYFLGLQKNPFKYLRHAAAFVFPSAWEGFPMALGEAMICGLPVLSSDCPTGPREMLAPATTAPTTPLRHAEQGEYGVLLPMLTQSATLAADQAVWTSAMTTLLSDEAERTRFSKLARQRIQDFSRERIFSQWLALVEEVGRG